MRPTHEQDHRILPESATLSQRTCQSCVQASVEVNASHVDRVPEQLSNSAVLLRKRLPTEIVSASGCCVETKRKYACMHTLTPSCQASHRCHRLGHKKSCMPPRSRITHRSPRLYCEPSQVQPPLSEDDEEVVYKDSWSDVQFINMCRRAYGNLAGWQSSRDWKQGDETYQGMLEVSRALMKVTA